MVSPDGLSVGGIFWASFHIFSFLRKYDWNLNIDWYRLTVCCSPTAARMLWQSAAVGRRRTARLCESQNMEYLSFVMPILTAFGGMTYFVLGRGLRGSPDERM